MREAQALDVVGQPRCQEPTWTSYTDQGARAELRLRRSDIHSASPHW